MPMEIKDLITVIALLISAIALWRNLRNDTKDDQSEMTTVIVKLETINENVKEVKADIKDVKSDIESLKQRVTICEQSMKSAHKRIDGIRNEHISEE